MSPGEIRRAFERIDRAMRGMVTVDMWSRENQHVRDQIVEGDRDCRERSDNVEEVALKAVERIERRADEIEKSALDAAKRVETTALEAAKRVETTALEAVKRIEDRGQITWGRVVAILTLILSLLGIAWTVYSSSKGIK